jgi:hypothetical protein
MGQHKPALAQVLEVAFQVLDRLLGEFRYPATNKVSEHIGN